MDLSGDLLIYIIGGLAFLAIAGLGFVLTGDAAQERTAKRAKQISTGEADSKRIDKNDPNGVAPQADAANAEEAARAGSGTAKIPER